MGAGTSSDRRSHEDSYVSPWIKWLMFTFNMIFWLISIGLIIIGAWAYVLTKEFNTNTGADDQPRDIFDILFDFTLLFIILGIVIFLFSFIGALGALRENICLLKTFAICLGILFVAEIAMAIAVLAFSGQAKAALQDILKEEAITDYREADINRRNIIDWFQETFECCGVGEEGWKSWKNNKWFSCNAPGFEACSVPYSCCKPEFRFKFDSDVIYPRCGHGTLALTRVDAAKTIFVKGCVDAAIETAQSNILIVGGVALAIVIPQLIGIAFAWVLARQVSEQQRRWK